MSESLSRKARKSVGWRELETLPELGAALPTGEEARRDRDRKRRQDKRAQRDLQRASGQPMARRQSPKQQPIPASVWDDDDLAADFLED